MGEATKNHVSTAYLGERFMRHPLTGRNLKELEIAEKAPGILERNRERLKAKAERKAPDGSDRFVYPTGFSLNRGRFEEYPHAEDTAHQRGWRAYMTVGVPLVEERNDIVQPPPDVVSKQTYVNRTDPKPTTWSHTVEFSVANTISWSLQGQVQLTFGAKAIASLQQQLQKSMALNNSQKTTLKNSKDNQGVDMESQSQSTSTTTATSSATGTGELSAQLMLGITGSVSGSLTTSFKTSSTLSGEVGSRVDVLATQRRQVRRFDYEYPVSFGGGVAVYYPEPVEVKRARPEGPPPKEPEYSQVIPWELGESGAAGKTFDLNDEGRPFLQKGEAELVSTLAGVHEVFELEKLHFEMKDHPLHKDGGEEARNPKEAPVQVRTGLGTADGLALDPVAQKAYVTDRYNGGKLYKVDLAGGGTDWALEKLGEVNDVALDLPGNKAYVADYGGRRVFTVDLSDHTASPVTVVEGIRVYGLALDLPGNRLFASDYARGELVEFDLSGGTAQRQRAWGVPNAAGVALNGGKAYVGQYDRGGLYEIDLSTEGGAPGEVATNLGYSVRVALHDGAIAYVCDSTGRLHEVVVAEGEAKGLRRVVADGLGPVCGLALDGANGRIYVSDRQGKLSRITRALPDRSAGS
ncbi:NHL repeat-containing protein [Nocardiopsis ganjiahuensis]|uniref:gluconolaconase n=1 Tax=Nocardiopsis ganjiahuensis TaxID=239984 RepID=UPI00059474D1|nr:gluconolaconase [Nocardiopsis ganjiahuensis]